MDGKLNVADWITRSKKPSELNRESTWQNGPDFLQLPMEEWPIKKANTSLEIPEQIRSVMVAVATLHAKNRNNITSFIKIERFSKYLTLIGTTARITSILETRPYSLLNIRKDVTTEGCEKAKMICVKECHLEFNENDMKSKYVRLFPQKLENGLWVVSGRTGNWMEISYNKQNVALLPFNHKFSRLYGEFVHSISLSGVLTSTAKVRLQFWIINLPKMMKSIVHHCVICRRKRKLRQEQILSPLPIVRIKPAPAWNSISIDYCGPFVIRGDVNKRARGKAYMVLFSCLVSRAVHVDVAASYDSNEFLKVLRRFVTIFDLC